MSRSVSHHPNIGDLISNKYLKVTFKIPKKGHLPNPVLPSVKVALGHPPRAPFSFFGPSSINGGFFFAVFDSTGVDEISMGIFFLT